MNDTLKQAVIEQLGYADVNDDGCKDTLQDVCNHGASGGYGAFVYHVDTCKFYQDNKSDILAMAGDMCESFGTGTLSEFISGFNCVDIDPMEIEAYLIGIEDEWSTTIENALAWYALEEVARSICDN